MDLAAVIQQLKRYALVFDGRVAGVSQLTDTIEDEMTLPPEQLPACFVVPEHEDAEGNDTENALYQLVTERIGVVVVFSSQADRRGQTASEQFAAVRASIFGAILNWRDLDPAHAMRGFEAAGGEPLKTSRYGLIYQWTFSFPTAITDADGWNPERPYLRRIVANGEAGDPKPTFVAEIPQPESQEL